jgi:hypothetical protein
MNAGESGKGSTRIEREILEILERADAPRTPIDHVSNAVRRRPTFGLPKLPTSINAALSPEVVKIVASVLLAICAAAVGGMSHLLGLVFAFLSAATFFWLWIPAGPSGLGDRPRWRGNDVGPQPRTPGWDPGLFGSRRGPKRPRR